MQHTRRFAVAPDRVATAPPETRGLPRDRVRLLVARPDDVVHTRASALPCHLRAGDLVIVNTSATRPAAIDGGLDGDAIVVHLSTELADGHWVVELRLLDGSGPVRHARAGQPVAVAGGGRIELLEHEDDAGDHARLWRARLDVPHHNVHAHMAMHGRPITYGARARRWPLAAYQTIFARHPGSAEMASAGRPFTHRLITELVTRGIGVAPVTLHAGVSSPTSDEGPAPEWYDVPIATAARIRQTRHDGGRVVAVGTTVTRALETVARRDGTVASGCGWTDLVVAPDRPARVVDALVTGWHEADASHLWLLDAVAGPALVDRAYAAALAGPYLWHEFGDACLLLPCRVNCPPARPGHPAGASAGARGWAAVTSASAVCSSAGRTTRQTAHPA
jgi:S-adenosylmethionine:tRNA ribosyltransferase-isomerase